MDRSLTLTKVESFFKSKDAIIFSTNFRGDDIIVVKQNEILTLLRFLRDDPDLKYDLFLDLTAADYLDGKKIRAANRDIQPYLEEGSYRFEAVYHLYSTEHQLRIRVKVPLKESDPTISSATKLYRGADWFEREIWDLYGIKVLGHPNLKRILLYEGFEGHPLRKDYSKTKRQPLIGPVN